jgi:hypothetical protein
VPSVRSLLLELGRGESSYAASSAVPQNELDFQFSFRQEEPMAMKSLFRFVREFKELAEDLFASSSSAARAAELRRL